SASERKSKPAFCSDLRQIHSFESEGPGPSTPRQARAAFTAIRPALSRLPTEAPSELKAGATEEVATIRSLDAVVSRYGYDIDRALSQGTPQEQAVMNAAIGPVDSSVEKLREYGKSA